MVTGSFVRDRITALGWLKFPLLDGIEGGAD